MIVKMFKELRRRLDEESQKLEVFNTELENIKKNQTELKNTVKGSNSRLDDTEVCSKLEDRVVKITKAKKKKEKKWRQLERPLRQYQAY